MERKIIWGLLLILLAVVIAGGFIYKEKHPAGKSRAVLAEPSVSPETGYEDIPVGSAKVPVAETPVPDDTDGLQVEIRNDILEYMQVTKEELAVKLQIYANESGNADADTVRDMDEMMISYAEKTVTVPCYFTIGQTRNKFDLIYQYEKKRYRFVPW